MAFCCPPGRGCNCSEREEPCILELCRQAADDELAAIAVRRWEVLQGTPGHNRHERRFRARAYERARDRALAALLMHAQLMSPSGRSRRPARTAQSERPRSAPNARQMTRLDVLLGPYRGRRRR
jgi:hypothetical protein